MTFPEDPLDVAVELAADSSGRWIDISEYVYTRDGITISRGRANESTQVEASNCSLTLDNRDGRFSPRNPLSPHYGKIGRNTPIRVLVPGDETYLALSTLSATSHADTPDDASLDISGDIDIRVDFERSTGQFAQYPLSKYTGSSSTSSWRIGISSADLPFAVWESTTLGVIDAASSVPIPSGRSALKVTLDVNDGLGQRITRFYTGASVDGPWTLLDTDTQSGAMTLRTSDVALRVGSSGSTDLSSFDGNVYAVQVRSGIDGTIVANPDFTAQPVGTTSFADSAGRTWTLQGDAEISDMAPRFTGEVAAWPQRWDPSDTDVYTQIEASGIMRRLGQGQALTAPTFRGFVEATGPYDYWPLDDPAGTTRGVNAGAGSSTSARFYGWPPAGTGYSNPAIFAFGKGDLGELLPPGLSVIDTAIDGYMRGDVGAGSSRTSVAVDFVYRATTVGYISMVTSDYDSGQGFYTVEVRDAPDNDVMVTFVQEVLDGFPTFTNLGNSSEIPSLTDGGLHHIRFTLTENGADLDWEVFVDGVSALDGTRSSTSFMGLAGLRFQYSPDAPETALALGHVAVWVDGDQPDLDATMLALRAYSEETAGRRIERICAENDITVTFIGDLDDTSLMGPQGDGSPLELIQECAETDLGILYEPRDSIGLVYRTRKSLYTQTAAVELGYEAGVFASTPEPVDDDQLTRNDVTAKRDGGGSARAVLESGPLSIQAPPDGVGPYVTEVTVSAPTDAHLPAQANWRMRLGTIDEPRYPVLHVNLASPTFTDTAALLTAVVGLDLGDLLSIENLPAWMPPDAVGQLVQGYTETLESFAWNVELNCSPALPYAVAVWGDTVGAGPDRYDTGGSRLATAATSTATTLSVEDTPSTGNTMLWTINDAEFPFDIIVGGERMTVTDITGATSPQTFTVTRSINGVVKAHADETPVRLFKTPRYGL